MVKGYIYILSNPAMPGVVKIGRSVNGGKIRAVELYSTGVPTPFTVEFDALVDDCVEMERLLHKKLNEWRIDQAREFFRVDADSAIRRALELITESFGCITVAAEYTSSIEASNKFAEILNEHPFVISASMNDLSTPSVKAAIKEWTSRHSAPKSKSGK